MTRSSSPTLLDSTYYVVRVYQCRGHRPASVAECYGSSTYKYPGKSGNILIPDGPSNAVTSVTRRNGTGQAEIEVRTKRESSTLGCDKAHPCSLVVIPNDGDPADPDLDYQNATQAQIDQPWAWANRVVPGGMRVNTHYKGLKYPLANFSARDPYPKFTHGFIPVLGLGEVARYLVTNRDNSESYTKDIHGNYPKTPPYSVGKRGLIAIVASADAAALRFPAARIRNAAGAFVGPTEPAMRSALDGMTTGKDKITKTVDFGRRSGGAYPLTMVHYAQAPTNGLDKAKAEKVARFLDHAAGPGQRPGLTPGLLPLGYVPLPEAMRAQTRNAAAEVRAQKGKLPVQDNAPVTPPTGKPNVPKTTSNTITLPVVAGPAPMGGRLSGALSPMVRWLLPVLLGGGLGVALLGAVMWGTGSAQRLRPPLPWRRGRS